MAIADVVLVMVYYGFPTTKRTVECKVLWNSTSDVFEIGKYKMARIFGLKLFLCGEIVGHVLLRYIPLIVAYIIPSLIILMKL